MELYNLKEDPFEQNNLADKMPEKKFAMRSLLETHFTNGSSRKGAKGESKAIKDILEEKYQRNKKLEELFS